MDLLSSLAALKCKSLLMIDFAAMADVVVIVGEDCRCHDIVVIDVGITH